MVRVTSGNVRTVHLVDDEVARYMVEYYKEVKSVNKVVRAVSARFGFLPGHGIVTRILVEAGFDPSQYKPKRKCNEARSGE